MEVDFLLDTSLSYKSRKGHLSYVSRADLKKGTLSNKLKVLRSTQANGTGSGRTPRFEYPSLAIPGEPQITQCLLRIICLLEIWI
jgi:hypothetical protein